MNMSAASMMLTGCVPALLNNQPSASATAPIAMAGYQEHHSFFLSKGSAVAQSQAKYLRDKAELDVAVDACMNGLPTCDPRIKPFASMLVEASKIPDRLTEARILQAWVNMIPYDKVEAAKTEAGESNLYHHSLKESLILKLVTCDEAGGLKLYGLEKLHFKGSDIRYVVENMYVNRQPSRTGHTVVEVRINNQNWIMNIWTAPSPTSFFILKTAEETIIDKSKMETDAAQLNLSEQSFWSAQNDIYIPNYEFNSSQIGYYSIDNAPLIALKAAEITTAFTPDELVDPNIERAIKPAFPENYTIIAQTPTYLAKSTRTPPPSRQLLSVIQPKANAYLANVSMTILSGAAPGG